MKKSGCRPILAALLVFLFLSPGLGEKASSMIGAWAFSHEPDEVVLKVSEDGNAVYRDREYTWEDTGSALKLTDGEGNSLTLRYARDGENTFLYPATVYEKTGKTDQPGLAGIWKETEGRGASFVFTPAGYFLEDSSFSGTYTADPELGQFLLHYDGNLADTLCYYTIGEDGRMTVEYPWPAVPVQ